MSANEGALEDPNFQRAYLAIRYFSGARGDSLSKALSAFQPPISTLATRLASQDRNERAQALALELERIVRSLQAQGLSEWG